MKPPTKTVQARQQFYFRGLLDCFFPSIALKINLKKGLKKKKKKKKELIFLVTSCSETWRKKKKGKREREKKCSCAVR